MPVADTIQVEIEARLGSLRAQMGQAERIVDTSAKHMAESTHKHGVFGLGTAGRGLNHMLAAVHLVRSAVEGVAEAFSEVGEKGERQIDPMMRGINAAFLTLDHLTFGIAGGIEKIVFGLTGMNVQLAEAQDRLEKSTKELSGARTRQGAEADLAIAQAGDPMAKAAAERRRAQLDIDAQAHQMQEGGARLGDIRRFVQAREKAADIKEVTSVYGEGAQEQLVPLLQEIARNTSTRP